ARHDDECVAAAELEHGLLNFAPGHARDRAPRFFASSERHRLHAKIDNYLFGLARFDEQRLKNSLWKTGAAEDVFNCERALRNVRGMLEQTDISRHQRRRGETEDLPEWKIPRHDREHGPEWLITNEAPRRLRLHRFVFQKTFGILRVESTTARAFLDLGDRIAQELPHFHRDDAREFFFLLFEQRCHRDHQERSLLEWFAAPFREGVDGALQASLDFGRVVRCKVFQLLARCRIDRRNRHCRSYSRSPFGIKMRSSKSNDHCTSRARIAAGIAPCKIVA